MPLGCLDRPPESMLRRGERGRAVGTTTCSNCHSVNQTGGIACIKCGEFLDDPESLVRRTRGRATPSPELESPPPADTQPPPPPPMPVPSDALWAETPVFPSQPGPPRKRIGLAIAIAISTIVLVVLFVMVVIKYKT
jgi:hypothetical protein